MKIMVCPLNGPRPVLEFAYGGEVRPGPDPDTCTDAEWSAHVFNRSGSPGVKYEWWCHIASGFWFIALRDTAEDRVLATYPAASVRDGLPTPGGQASGQRPAKYAPDDGAGGQPAIPGEERAP
jgi:sarcosine oxidase subunit delta